MGAFDVTYSDKFEFLPNAIVADSSLLAGSVNGGTTMVLSGKHFGSQDAALALPVAVAFTPASGSGGAAAVVFGVQPFVVNVDSRNDEIHVKTPQLPAGDYIVTVVHDNDVVPQFTANYEALAAPTAVSVSPE